MGMFTGSTPAEIADALEALARYPHNTGMPSMLDEATLAYAGKYPAVRGPQLAFARARLAHMRSYSRETGAYSEAAWDSLMDAAWDLAAVLRPLGDAVIPRCKRATPWGDCTLPLQDDGTCRSSDHDEN